MKFKRLVDNKPAYTAGKIYNVVKDSCEFTGQALAGVVIENDMGSQCYYSLNGYYAMQEFNRLWKEEK